MLLVVLLHMDVTRGTPSRLKFVWENFLDPPKNRKCTRKKIWTPLEESDPPRKISGYAPAPSVTSLYFLRGMLHCCKKKGVCICFTISIFVIIPRYTNEWIRVPSKLKILYLNKKFTLSLTNDKKFYTAFILQSKISLKNMSQNFLHLISFHWIPRPRTFRMEIFHLNCNKFKFSK